MDVAFADVAVGDLLFYGEVRLECPEYLQAVLGDVGGHDGCDGYDDCLHDAGRF